LDLQAKKDLKNSYQLDQSKSLKRKLTGEDSRGKFGRVLGDFLTDDERRCTAILVEEGHAVAYFGGSKDDVDAQHMANRTRLLENGTMTQAVYDAAVEEMQ
jgi:endonuclease YncB( thermonuclease family)